ncbi:MAG: type II toxin-antitoxin system PemK/MazF family toxin [Anaerolineales bacterium]|jgi:mRNA interferase MazF|nr:type II toxin-antitoxin system PemK/MazF family toxin [Anaerolineales bacterium]
MTPILRGDVFTVDLEPVRGSEQGKARPALVIQNDIGNRFSPTIIVAPITSGNYTKFDVNVEIKAPEGGLANNSIILLNQIRTVDRTRFGRYWGRVSAETMQKVDEAIKISLGLVKI